MSHQGERSVWEFILISSWRQSPPHASCAASSSVPLHPKISITQERSDQPVLPSLWKKAASCQVSLVTATAPLNRHSSSSEGTGFTGSTKAEKSYTFYCRFSVSVLESTAALEADIVPTSLPHETATNSSAPGNSKNHAWVCSADKCSSEDQASHMTRH